MKKILSLMLALMLLCCAAASAQTIYTKVTVDRDMAGKLLQGFGMPEDQMGMVDPILALINALGVNVTTVEGGGQVDLDLNGKGAVSLGWASDEAGVSIVSTLFPSYMVTVSLEMIEGLIQQFAANMPGTDEGGIGGFDLAAIQEVLGGHIAKWMGACASAGQPGEAVSGEYEFYGVSFDTMVPITVDVLTIKAATATLLDDLMADPAAMSMLKGMAQGMAQQKGESLDEANFEEEFKAAFEEWMAHFPETVTAEFYANSDGSEGFYLVGDSVMEGMDEASFSYDMLYQGQQSMLMHCRISGEEAIEIVFALEGTDMRFDFSMSGMYFGLELDFTENEFDVYVYFLDPDNPLVTVNVAIAEGGERTLAVDAEGKTVVAFELPMDGNNEAFQSLLGDIMGNGLGSLVGMLIEEVPEAGALMGMAG